MLAIMRDDEKYNVQRVEKTVRFFFGTVNEDAEFSSARFLGVDFRKAGRVMSFSVCSLPTHCSSDYAYDEEKFLARKQCLFLV